MKTNLQAFSVDLPESESASWIQILPAGKFKGFDGRGPYELRDAAAVIAASKREKTDLVIDRDHQTLFMPRGTEVPAAGWMKELAAREDGSVWARVEWTEKAAAQLAAKEYRYLSPVFKHDADGNIIAILHASLTNNPNLELTAIASADPSLFSTPKENDPMDEFVKKLAALLGLAETATADEVVTAITERLQSLSAANADVASIRAALKLDEKADAKAVIAAMAAVTTTAAAEPNPAEYVSMSAFNEVSTTLAKLQKDIAAKNANEAVSAAMKAGKISPAQKTWALGYASADLEAFNKFVETAPVIVTASSGVDGQPGRTGSGLSPEIAAFAAQIGVPEEDLKKNMKGEDAVA